MSSHFEQMELERNEFQKKSERVQHWFSLLLIYINTTIYQDVSVSLVTEPVTFFRALHQESLCNKKGFFHQNIQLQTNGQFVRHPI